MTLTRSLINKRIKYHDWIINRDGTKVESFSYDHLSRLVDAYKNLFQSQGLEAGQRVIIATRLSIVQLAVLLACAELGLTVLVVGNPFSGGYQENTTLDLSFYGGADLFVVCNQNCTKKYDTLSKTSRRTIVLDEQPLDYTGNDTILAHDDSVLFRILDNNTTVEHTQEFIVTVLERASFLFENSIGTSLDNLNHGISPGVHFLPGLLSDRVTDYHSFYVVENSIDLLSTALAERGITLSHLFVPQTTLVVATFDTTLNQCSLYTSGGLRPEWTNRLLQGKVKDIISLWGHSQTWGPVLINRASGANFAPNAYTQVDDFYEVSVTQTNELAVTVPVYDKKVIINNDLYLVDRGKIKFKIKPK